MLLLHLLFIDSGRCLNEGRRLHRLGHDIDRDARQLHIEVAVGLLNGSRVRVLIALAFAAEEVGRRTAKEVFADAAGFEFVVASLFHIVSRCV